MSEEIEREKIFFNAVSGALASNYSALKKIFEKCGNWEKAALRLSLSEKGAHSSFAKLREKEIAVIMAGEPSYPELLRHIPHPPFALYFRGNSKLLQTRKIAVVGTRKASDSGRRTAFNFSGELGKYLTVVSGLAFGIDSASHEGTLAIGGKTIVVLASGVDRITPRTNEQIAQKLLDAGGAVISERSPGSPVHESDFLARNRIVSGLCEGVLVIEAPARSGSLATARFALEQNRSIFVVPGAVSDPRFAGSNLLIRDGAELVTEPSQILEALGIKTGKKEVLELEFAPEELPVISLIKSSSSPLDIDKISEITKLEIHDAIRIVMQLVLKGALKETERGFII